nr:hypothetical protein [Janthinobacterium sp. Ant5-2-1]
MAVKARGSMLFWQATTSAYKAVPVASASAAVQLDGETVLTEQQGPVQPNAGSGNGYDTKLAQTSRPGFESSKIQYRELHTEVCRRDGYDKNDDDGTISAGHQYRYHDVEQRCMKNKETWYGLPLSVAQASTWRWRLDLGKPCLLICSEI